MKTLFDSIQVGALKLPNRIIMSPLTRSRAGDERLPNDLMAEYYSQRADAGFILTEATSVTPMGVGYAATPGIWSDAQVEGWKKITKAVHAKGGRILLQLWHVGRISDPMFLNGAVPEAPSAIRPNGHVSLVRPMKEYVTPHELSTSEVKDIVKAFRKGAENAKAAGFDGVELHGANGYLLDQFLQSSTNHRKDEYGGSIENRARLGLEVTDQCIQVWGADRVGYHMAPQMDSHDMGDETPRETFGYLARELGRRKIAFIFLRDGQTEKNMTAHLKKEFGGIVIANQGLDKDTAEKIINRGDADLVSWGKLFIANPDLVTRLRENAPLAQPDQATMYGGEAHGYTDYPRLGH
jgi:2,4-dienoyl-CoA reductase-like NADH-dependent reductase (Old Yellow Enzyme family)